MSITKTVALFYTLTLTISQTVFAGGCCSVPKIYCAECEQPIDKKDFAITAAEICGETQANSCFHIDCFLRLQRENIDRLAGLCTGVPLELSTISKNMRIRARECADANLHLKAIALMAESERERLQEALRISSSSLQTPRPPEPSTVLPPPTFTDETQTKFGTVQAVHDVQTEPPARSAETGVQPCTIAALALAHACTQTELANTEAALQTDYSGQLPFSTFHPISCCFCDRPIERPDDLVTSADIWPSMSRRAFFCFHLDCVFKRLMRPRDPDLACIGKTDTLPIGIIVRRLKARGVSLNQTKIAEFVKDVCEKEHSSKSMIQYCEKVGVAAIESLSESEVQNSISKCPICFGLINDEEKASGLEIFGCSKLHFFHKHCIDSWLARSDTCPCCRARKKKPLEQRHAPAGPSSGVVPDRRHAVATGYDRDDDDFPMGILD